MNWKHYWANQLTKPKLIKDTQYLEWLQEKNLAPTTIRSYLDTLARFNQSFTTQGVKTYFQNNQRKYQPTTLKTKQYALNSYLKFKQLKVEWEKIARLIPKVQKKFFTTLKENELAKLKTARVEKNLQIHQRNNLLLDFLFTKADQVEKIAGTWVKKNQVLSETKGGNHT